MYLSKLLKKKFTDVTGKWCWGFEWLPKLTVSPASHHNILSTTQYWPQHAEHQAQLVRASGLRLFAEELLWQASCVPCTFHFAVVFA